MWISNRGHVFRDGSIILHPSGVFSNVLMQKKRRGIRKTSDLSKIDCDGSIILHPSGVFSNVLMQKKRRGLSKIDCSIHDICRQRYRVYYESYRDEIVQGRVRSETASFDNI